MLNTAYSQAQSYRRRGEPVDQEHIRRKDFKAHTVDAINDWDRCVQKRKKNEEKEKIARSLGKKFGVDFLRSHPEIKESLGKSRQALTSVLNLKSKRGGAFGSDKSFE